MRHRALVLLWPWVVLLSAIVSGQERIDFNRQIRPILSDRCFQCHGPDEAERYAGFRLDERESATHEADSGSTPIVPGNAQASALIHRVTAADSDLRMPPPTSNKPPLSKDEVELVRRWIEQGAEWEPHWSFIAPQRAELPAQRGAAWVRNPIDRFVLARLQQDGLSPSPEADKRTLIRRVSLDLIGLPPTPEEVKQFVHDDSPDAYEKLVDRLLASPQYGERMAWPWLDAARYADTNGYQGDPERTMWPWRDWVVNALNNNMPFDQFTREQLSGDLLPDPTPAQIIATGFNRNHMHNGEGGRIAEETRVENVFDRTETTATVWLGLTFTCCRCHTHKFDPITHTEYYALYDFFNQTSEAGGIRGGAVPPAVTYVPPESQHKLDDWNRQLAELRGQMLADDETADAAQMAWESKVQQQAPWTVPTLVSSITNTDAKLVPLEDGSLRAEGPVPNQDIYTVVARTDRQNLTAIRLEALPDEIASPTGSTGRAANGNAVLSEMEVYVRPINDPDSSEQRLSITSGKAEHAQPGHPIEQAFDGHAGGREGWATEGFRRQESNTAVLFTAEPFGYPDGTEIRFVLRFESIHAKHILARVRLAVGNGESADALSAALRDVLTKTATDRTKAEAAELRRTFRAQFYDSPIYRELAANIKELEQQQKSLQASLDKTKVMVMDTLAKPRETRILEKGLYDQPLGEPISAAVPSVLPPLDEDAPRNRLGLARWLVAPENPLTARVTVNRYWQLFFGKGLVTTPGDFGTQGKPPSHPQLLDWLAVKFVESGWDVKQMHRLIVTSATYRQSSDNSEELRNLDPENVLLARQNRHRLPSWMLRDQALYVSGLASLNQGGPPVKPYQPEGIWAEATFGKKKYQRDSGEALYRRSLYVFWRRIVGPTMFFDVANRQTCSVQTAITNTPLHALTTLNDTTYVEAARGLATRVLGQSEDDSERLRRIFLYLTAREPDSQEQVILASRLEKLEREFAQAPEEATKLLTVGESPYDASANLAELAAYTALCNTLMNLDEALNRP